MTIIIGAGISGLVAARKISGKENVTILEKDNGVGGRIRTDSFNGFKVDIGTQCFFEGYRNTFDLIREVNLEKDIIELKEPSISFYRNGKFYPFNIKGFLSFGSIKEKYYVLKLLKKIKDIDKKSGLSFTKLDSVEKLDELSIADWVIENFNEDFLEYSVQPIVSGLVLTAPENVSAAYGLPLLKHVIEKAFILKNGIGSLAEKIVKDLPKNTSLKLNSDVEEILIDDNEVKGVRYKNKGGSILVEDKNVISSIPIPSLLEITKNLPNEFKKNLSKVEYAPCVHVLVALEKDVSGTWGLFFSRKDFDKFSVITNTQRKGKQFVSNNNFMLEIFIYGESAEKLLNKTDDEISDSILEDLKLIFPKIEDEIVWHRAIKIKHAMSIPKPGFLELRKCFFNLPVEGLKLCGDYMYWPSVEAAICSGLKV